MAMPVIVRAQAPLTVKFVQQRGLLYLPVCTENLIRID
jgi:hypothetical protein